MTNFIEVRRTLYIYFFKLKFQNCYYEKLLLQIIAKAAEDDILRFFSSKTKSEHDVN